MPKHSGSDGFQDGLPGICDECFKEQKPSERYYCPHDKRLAVLSEGCWETFRDVEAGEMKFKEALNQLYGEPRARSEPFFHRLIHRFCG